MSAFDYEHLRDNTRIGHNKLAWFHSAADVAQLKELGVFFEGPVPMEAALDVIGWNPVSFTVESVVEPATMESYEMPDKYRTFVARPGTGVVLNIAGSGYATGLHNTMREALITALDAQCEISSAVCLGDGQYLGMSLLPNDNVVVGAHVGGLQPYVSFNSSLTGAMATGFTIGATRIVCDNTMRASWAGASARFAVKRTRNAEQKVTASIIREALDISFAGCEQLVVELEQMANVEVTDKQLSQILEIWKPTDDLPTGRALTLATSAQSAIRSLVKYDPRVALGQTLAGIWQAHNTYQHHTMTARGPEAKDRIGRQMLRTADGSVDDLDTKFMEIVAGVLSEDTPTKGEML